MNNMENLRLENSLVSNSRITIRQVFPLANEVISLIDELDKYQIALYGLSSCNLDSPQQLIASRAYMLGAYDENTLIGIGAVKILDSYAEVKRMYVTEKYRGFAVGENILLHLEEHVRKEGIRKIFLETGYLQHNAIRFYKRLGYHVVERFGNYQPNSVSMYFHKLL